MKATIIRLDAERAWKEYRDSLMVSATPGKNATHNLERRRGAYLAGYIAGHADSVLKEEAE